MIDAPFSSPSHAILPGNPASGVLVVADHASCALPSAYGGLGLPPGEIERHIGYDIGVADVVRALNRLAGLPVVMAGFSRLLIDPNRGEDDPTLVMRLSDGAIVPGNAAVGAEERQRRIEGFHRPYHQAIEAALADMASTGVVPVLLSVHSFTPVWKGRRRPWEIGVLWDRDPRLAAPLIAALDADGIVVGDNEPYDGALKGDGMYSHGSRPGRAHVLVEFRQDLVGDQASAARWAERLWSALAPIVADPGVHAPRHYGSRADD